MKITKHQLKELIRQSIKEIDFKPKHITGFSLVSFVFLCQLLIDKDVYRQLFLATILGLVITFGYHSLRQTSVLIKTANFLLLGLFFLASTAFDLILKNVTLNEIECTKYPCPKVNSAWRFDHNLLETKNFGARL